VILRILWSQSRKGNASSCLRVQAHLLLVKDRAIHWTTVSAHYQGTIPNVVVIEVGVVTSNQPDE
jgi:hypothetical protein